MAKNSHHTPRLSFLGSKCSLRWLLGSALAFGFAAEMYAGSIRGRVYDVANAIYIQGAEVAVVGEERSVFSEDQGRFSISGLEPGSYTLQVNTVGFPPIQRSVTVREQGEVVNLVFELRLDEDVIDLEEFEVVGSTSATIKALNIERSANDLREVVASDVFGQFVDRNPAEALQRVAGVAVEDDQGEGAFVIIRGASPDLSNVQLDGIEVATPQPDGRRVNLNIITVDQLERIEVSKTWLPSQKGNTIGGTVNLVTRSALDRGAMFASTEFAYTNYSIADDESYRGQVTFGDTIDSDDWEWLGDMAIGIQISASYSEDNRGSETVSFGWELDAGYPFGGDPLYGYTIVNNRWRDYSILRERQAISSKIEFRLNENHEFFISGSYNQFDDDEVQQFFSRSASTGNDFNWDGLNGEFLTESAALELGYDLNDPEIIARLGAPTTSTLRRFRFDEVIQLGDLSYDPESSQFTFGSWVGNFSRNFDNEITSDELFTYQIGGSHTFFSDLKLEWKVYRSDADRETDRLTFNFGGPGGRVNTVTGGELPQIDPSEFTEVSLNADLYERFEPSSGSSGQSTIWDNSFTFSEDERTGFSVDAEMPFQLFGLSLITQVGVTHDQREKIFRREFATSQIASGAFDDDLYPGNRLRLSDEIFYGGESDGFVDNFGDFFRFGPTLNVDGFLQVVDDPAAFGITLADEVEAGVLSDQFFDRLVDDYESTEDILGIYWQQTVQWRRWSFIFGFRWEETQNSFTNLTILTRNPETGQFIRPSFWRFLDESDYSTVVTSERTYDNFLPAFHVRRDIGDSMIFRGSVTQTIARPRFDQVDAREIPSLSGGAFGSTLQVSNFDSIRPMESINYDLSFEKYFDPIGKIEVAVFYKDLDGPLYNERRIAVGPDDETREYAFRYDSRNANRTGPDDPTLINSSPWTFNKVTNAGDAELYGFEFSFSTRLDTYLPEALRGFSFEGNFAIFESEVELLAEERVAPRDSRGEIIEVDPTVPLFRQPDRTANLSWIFERGGFFARVSYNFRGSYLTNVFTGDDVGQLLRFEDSPAALDTYIDDTERWDFTLRYNATRSVQLFVEILNFTNEPQLTYLGEPERPSSLRYTEAVYTFGVKIAL